MAGNFPDLLRGGEVVGKHEGSSPKSWQLNESFKHFHSKEFFDQVEATVKDDMGVHLPNHLDFTIAYQFIANLLSEI